VVQSKITMTCILGIETSCDETSAAVVDDGRTVRSNVVASQIDLHRKYGGVVPEIASRAHVECLDVVIQEAMTQADCKPDSIDAVAVTYRPGLVGSLLIGVTAANIVPGSAPSTTAAGNGSVFSFFQRACCCAPPRWRSQRISVVSRPVTCIR